MEIDKDNTSTTITSKDRIIGSFFGLVWVSVLLDDTDDRAMYLDVLLKDGKKVEYKTYLEIIINCLNNTLWIK